ncbi:dynamin family protein [Peribacillus kribbensis]|uniref:dynamin family protein n=1 Tax=Peribacillus kribbensis TaxID=356658 RepID=UPI00041F7F39|nr:dynamin family protein [Peribacillus kribbensis]
MNFLDDIDKDEGYKKSKASNRYLDNPEEALILISNLLKTKEILPDLKRAMYRLERLIQDDFRKFAGKFDMVDEIAIYQKLLQIVDKIKEMNRFQILDGKNFIAIGGGFSAGKSKFLNSIIGLELLPEDQTPTTSVPTYIMKGKEKLSAYTFRNQVLDIGKEALKALSHEFYNQYKLSFSKLIKNINVQTPFFPYENLILLDTPGYTKAESYKLENNTDEHIAREQLRIADFIIWLMDIDDGVITDKDLDFIAKLRADVPILFVFNKADIKPESQVEEIVSNTKEIISKRGLNVFGVTAYSSLLENEYAGDYIQAFFKYANKPLRKGMTFKDEFEDAIKEWDIYFKDTGAMLLKQQKEVGELLSYTKQVTQFRDLAELYSSIHARISEQNVLHEEYAFLKTSFSRLMNKIDSLTLAAEP